MTAIRIGALALALLGLVWVQFVSAYPATAYMTQAADLIDDRPSKRVLFIGNSRSFSNDMPATMREIADASGAPFKLQIVEHLLPGARLRDHWANDKVHALIEAERWDEIIIQAQSASHLDGERRYFHEYAPKLVRKAQDNAETVRVFVTWPYDDAQFPEVMRHAYHRRIQSDHQTLASNTGVELTNVGKIWEEGRSHSFDFALTTDGNHPSAPGSFIAALALYTDMAGGALRPISYRPDGVSEEQSARIQERVGFHWQIAGDI